MGLLENQDDEQKPLFRKWINQAKREKRSTLYLPIEKIKLSGSEEWIIIEASEAVALLNAESKLGREFWKNLESFNGKGMLLNICPCKGKLGFDVTFDDKKTCFYIWEDGVLHISPKKTLDTNSQMNLNALTWETSQQKLEMLSSKQSSKAQKTNGDVSIQTSGHTDSTETGI